MTGLYREKSNPTLIQRESFYTHKVGEVIVYHKLINFSPYYLGTGAMAACYRGEAPITYGIVYHN